MIPAVVIHIRSALAFIHSLDRTRLVYTRLAFVLGRKEGRSFERLVQLGYKIVDLYWIRIVYVSSAKESEKEYYIN